MNYETLGERICYCRNLLGLTQREFAVELDVSKASITRWEIDGVKIPPKQILALIEFFNSRCLLVSHGWLTRGVGTIPILQHITSLEKLNFDELTYVTLNHLKKINNFEFYQINTKFFEPILSYADYVAGVCVSDKQTLNNKLCFAITPIDIIVGFFDFTCLQLKNINNEIYQLADDFVIGEVLWMSRRF